jgi:hypothetical protein
MGMRPPERLPEGAVVLVDTNPIIYLFEGSPLADPFLPHGLKLPDAIQLAVALHDGCDALVTHDRDFSKVDDLPIISG